MSRTLRIAAAQAAPLPVGNCIRTFGEDVERIIAADPGIQCLVYPELHLFDVRGTQDEQWDQLQDSAVNLDGPLVSELADIARSAGVWLVPGSVCEIDADGKYYNTAIVLSPEGELVSHYRKIFPWRPYERHEPGREFEVFEIPGVGRLGLSICYDAWFPEVTRHLAWMGAEIVLNVVKTTTPDRVQELVLAQANSIVNQTFTVSVNTAGPEGEGFSLIVDPEGVVLESAPSREEALLTHTIDLDHVSRTREFGTAGFNRLWSQFLPTDAALDLPLYGGRIEPMKWAPAGRSANARIVPTAEGVGGQKRATREV